MIETRVERITSMSKSPAALLVFEPNTSDEVTPLHNIVQSSANGFRNEAFHGEMLLDNYHVAFEYELLPSFGKSCA